MIQATAAQIYPQIVAVHDPTLVGPEHFVEAKISTPLTTKIRSQSTLGGKGDQREVLLRRRHPHSFCLFDRTRIPVWK